MTFVVGSIEGRNGDEEREASMRSRRGRRGTGQIHYRYVRYAPNRLQAKDVGASIVGAARILSSIRGSQNPVEVVLHMWIFDTCSCAWHCGSVVGR